MSNIIQNKRINSNARINYRCICPPDNITTIPLYHIHDSLSYHVSRCNYCGQSGLNIGFVTSTC